MAEFTQFGAAPTSAARDASPAATVPAGTRVAIYRLAAQESTEPLRTFSIGYVSPADSSYDELDAARMLARHFGAEHTEERLQPDIVGMLPRIVRAMGEPFADASAIPTYLVSEVARRSVTVALSPARVSANTRSQTGVPVLASSAIRCPFAVTKRTLPSATATPRCCTSRASAATCSRS